MFGKGSRRSEYRWTSAQRREDARLGRAARAINERLRLLVNDVNTYKMYEFVGSMPASTPAERADAITEIVIAQLPEAIAQDVRGSCGADPHHLVFSVYMEAIRIALPPSIARYIKDGPL